MVVKAKTRTISLFHTGWCGRWLLLKGRKAAEESKVTNGDDDISGAAVAAGDGRPGCSAGGHRLSIRGLIPFSRLGAVHRLPSLLPGDLPLNNLTLSSSSSSSFLLMNCSWSQPFKVLHGGISALVAEALASVGAHMASGFRRVAGVQLSVNHHRPAALGEVVVAEARPVSVGRNIQVEPPPGSRYSSLLSLIPFPPMIFGFLEFQVWEVELWKGVAEGEKRALLASSRVTLMANLPVSEESRAAAINLRKHAKL